jgi:hypothetical protein
MDPLGDTLTTRPIQTGWQFTMEPYLSGQSWCIDDVDRQFGNGSVWTRTLTQSDGPVQLLTLVDTVMYNLKDICICIIKEQSSDQEESQSKH